MILYNYIALTDLDRHHTLTILKAEHQSVRIKFVRVRAYIDL